MSYEKIKLTSRERHDHENGCDKISSAASMAHL
nr:MAG TPA: hypothetical protein [Caudoviricetes sp.]